MEWKQALAQARKVKENEMWIRRKISWGSFDAWMSVRSEMRVKWREGTWCKNMNESDGALACGWVLWVRGESEAKRRKMRQGIIDVYKIGRWKVAIKTWVNKSYMWMGGKWWKKNMNGKENKMNVVLYEWILQGKDIRIKGFYKDRKRYCISTGLYVFKTPSSPIILILSISFFINVIIISASYH